MPRDDRLYMDHILESCRKIRQFTAGALTGVLAASGVTIRMDGSGPNLSAESLFKHIPSPT